MYSHNVLPNPVLTQSSRNGVVETVNRGVICVVGKSNKVLYQAGNIQQYSYPRSSMKLVQAVPLILSGAIDHYQITPEEIAVICASHNTEPKHLETVRNILTKAQIPEKYLACGPHNPIGEEAYYNIAQKGEPLTDIHNNCSGKHAGFLVLAKHLGVSLEGYLHPDHPVQQRVRQAVMQMYEIEESKMVHGIDGCSAPNYAMPVYHQAIGFKNLCSSHYRDKKLQSACLQIITAMTSFPFMVAGSKRFCTDLMRTCGKHIIGKLGAEGVYAMGVIGRDIGCAIKIDDGMTGPQYNVASKFLKTLNLFSSQQLEPLINYKKTPIYNCRKILVGYREVSKDILSEPLFQ